MNPLLKPLLRFGLSAVIAAVLWSLLGALEETERTATTDSGGAALAAEPSASAVSAMPPGNEVVVLRRELTALREEVALLRAQVLAQTAAGSEIEQPEDAGIGSGKETSAQALEQASQEAAQRHSERLETIESALLGESVDPSWSLEASRGIEQVFARGMYRQARLLGVECRATLCRVDVLHQGPEEIQQFAASFPAEVAGYANRMTMRQMLNEDGTVTTVLYLGRDGYPFPS